MIKKETNYLDPLLFLRILSIFLVFSFHTMLDTNIGYGSNITHSTFSFLLKLPAWGGVWILIVLSGFLIGKGFFDEKYEMSIKGVAKFYYKRFVKIVIPYYIFILIGGILTYSTDYINMPELIPKLLLLNYKGDIGFGGIGPTWFISTICRLYLVAPFAYLIISYLIKKIKKHKNAFVIGLMITLLLFGLGIRSYQFLNSYNWVSQTYPSLLSNIDLFFIGMLLNHFCNNKIVINDRMLKVFKTISVILLMSLILLTAYIHDLSDNNYKLLIIYKYYFPSLYIIFTSFYLFVFTINKNNYCKPTIKNIIKNPLKILEVLSKQSFEFYLWHTVILRCLTMVIFTVSYINHYIALWILTFIIGNIFAYLFTLLDESVSTKLLSFVNKK